MSTDPSQDHPHHREQLARTHNGSSSSSGSSASTRAASGVPGQTSACTEASPLVTDQVLLREVAEIAEKVRELEKSVPCQWEFSDHDGVQQLLSVDEQDTRSGSGVECGQQSVANVHTMSSTRDKDDGLAVAGGAAEAQQSSERLIIKSESNKSSGFVVDDNNSSSSRSDAVVGKSLDHVPCPAMNEEDIKALVKELKRKIEHTERMNWLCKY